MVIVQEKKLLVLSCLGFLVLLLTIVGTFIYQQKQLTSLKRSTESLQQSPTSPVMAVAGSTIDLPQSSLSGSLDASSASSTLEQLQQQITDLTTRLTKVEKKIGLQTTTKPSSPDVREYVVYLGNGQTDNRDWTNITSAVATIDSANYNKVKSVYFEAALSIIGGEAHARLANQTTGQIFYQTEVFNNTSVSDWIRSSALTLATGQNSYVVQLRSTSGEIAVLNGARLHIYLQ